MDINESIESMNRKDLQSLAKKYGIRANMASEEIRSQLLQKINVYSVLL